MNFNELNTIEPYIIYKLSGARVDESGNILSQDKTKTYSWTYKSLSEIDRDINNTLWEREVINSLIRLNPEIAVEPSRAEEVLYKLRAILLSVDSTGLVRANEEFSKWLTGEKTMPFGENSQHVPVTLIDFDNFSRNTYIITNQYTLIGRAEKRPDIVMLVNGFPLVVGELKTPVRPSISWYDGAVDINDDYQNTIPQLFVPNLLSFATEGKLYRYGSVRMPLELWGPWKTEESKKEHSQLKEIDVAIEDQFRPEVLLDLLQNFTLFATDTKNRRIKILARYQQYEGANKIVDRVRDGKVKQGLLWHFQGSGKSYLIVYAAQKLRRSQELKSPTVLVIIDRQDLDTQMSGTFSVTDIPNVVQADSGESLRKLLEKDTRKIIITMMHKFREVEGVLNERENIIALVDEAHRTQEGDLGRKMRSSIPNAYLFGLTGTPINKDERNTFYAFGSPVDTEGYMSLYSFTESIEDGATLELHFDPRLLNVHIDKSLVDEGFAELTPHLSLEDRQKLVDQAAKMSVFLKSPDRIQHITRDIVRHFNEHARPQGFKAMIVVPDRDACDLYKKALDEIIPTENSAVVVSTSAKDNLEFRQKYNLTKDQEEKLIEAYKDPSDPLQFLIVTAKLLTGFDAPILQTMYLDKSIKDHTLLQAICRTNRVYKNKTHGLIVDYYGVFDDVATALKFDSDKAKNIVTNISQIKQKLPEAVRKCLDHFKDIDRRVEGFEGLELAQGCLNSNDLRDGFAKDYSELAKLWEAISPDQILNKFEQDYRWLTQVYQSVKPDSGDTGRLLWHALGAQTTELIHKNIHIDTVDNDIENIILDASLIETLVDGVDKEKAKKVEEEIAKRLKKHKDIPEFIALSKRLDDLRARALNGLITSVDFLKELASLARDVVATENGVVTDEEKVTAKSALTELFLELKTETTPAIVEKIVADIDDIVNIVRFPGWQTTNAGEREVQQALRKTLLRYKLHKESELFNRCYSYIREYY